MIPSRSRGAWLLELALAVVVALVVRAHPHALGGGAPVSVAFWAVLLSAIEAALGWIANQAVTISTVLWEVFKQIGPALWSFAKTVGSVFVRVWGYFSEFYTRVLKPFIGWAWTQIQRLHTWLVRTFAPVLKHLRTLRQWILTHYDKWLRPIFATIDVVRAIVRTLATLHVPFAQAVDRKLADLEARLMAPIRFALAKVNEAINWINRIVTIDGLFQRLTLIQSQWTYVGDLWNVLLQHSPAGVSAADNAQRRAQTVTPLDAATLSKQVIEYYTTGGGELAPAIKAAIAASGALAVQ